MAKNSISLMSFGLLLIGIYVMFLSINLNTNLILTIIGFAGGLLLTLVELKFLWDRINGK